MAVLAFFFGPRKFLERVFEANRKRFFLFFLTVFQLAYLAVGAFIFIAIEGSDKFNETIALSVKSKMMAKYPNISGEALDEVFKELSSQGVKGITPNNWTFGNAFLFAATLLTTIGYGHLSPSSQLGKLVTMVYSTLGIPLMLLTISCYLEVFNEYSCAFKANLFNRFSGKKPFTVRLLHISVIMTFIAFGCFFLPAAVFFWLEESWSYLDALYFCFISITTVGLGDFVPGIAVHHAHVELYRFIATLYLIGGVTVMMFMLAAVGDFIQNYNSPYTVLPVAIIPDACPIKMPAPRLYGAIEVSISESMEEKMRLLNS